MTDDMQDDATTPVVADDAAGEAAEEEKCPCCGAEKSACTCPEDCDGCDCHKEKEEEAAEVPEAPAAE